MGAFGLMLAVPSFAAIDPATAWWNAEDFESYELGTDMKVADTWTGGVNALILKKAAAGDNALMMNSVVNADNVFTETSQGGGRSMAKTFTNALSGIVHVKTDIYGGSTGATFQLVNTAGSEVFFITIAGGNSNALSFTGKSTTDVAYGARRTWINTEFLLDLDNNKLLKIVFNSNAAKTFTDVDLTNAGDVKKLNINLPKGWLSAGLDNVTVGQLIADKLKDFTGAASLQTLTGEDASANYALTAFTTAMELDLTIDRKDADIEWTISDYGTLAEGEKALVALVKDTEDSRKATLTAGAISADATITLKAELGAVSVTKTVEVKTPSLDGIKQTLLDEIATATGISDAVIDSNPYITGLKATLTTAMGAAQDVYDDGTATMSGVAQAISDLQAAESDFTTALVSYNAFVANITTVQDAHDAEARSAAFFVAIKATLQSAIDAATAARTTVATTADVDDVTAALQAALGKFEADAIVYETLEADIATVTTRYTAINLRKGDYFLQYPEAVVDNLSAAITSANNLLTTGTDADDLAAETTALNDALATFNSTPRNAPSSSNSYRIYTYGNDGGNGDAVSTNKKVLYVDADTEILKYALVSNLPSVANRYDEWGIEETSTGVYTLKNLGLNKYLSNSTTLFSDVAVDFAIVDNKGQNAAEYVVDGYFQYGIRYSTNKWLEVDLYDETEMNGVFIYSTSAAPIERLRFCFQFEENGLITGIDNETATVKEVQSVEYFDLTGKVVTSDYKGFVIERVIYTDGTTANLKKLK
ncbi:hypothetical protein D0T53_09385 [Dysgonomonas sp. 216]|nr:hypothetical protein [Dysgonomonas sp. 216]